jgi:antirestriction protein ArdC
LAGNRTFLFGVDTERLISATDVRRNGKEVGDRRDPMQEFADQIVEQLEAGVKPWPRPWDSSKCGGPRALMNPVMKHNLRVINFLIVGIGLLAFQTSDPRWCSFLQAKEKGWTVKKGSKATTISSRRFDREGCQRRAATSRRARPSGCLPKLFRMSALRTGAAMRTNRGQAGPTSYHMNRAARRHVFESGRRRWGS